MQSPLNGCEIREVRLSTNVNECPVINIPVGRKETYYTWLVDSGAPINVIDEMSFKSEFPDIPLLKISPNVNFKTADGSPLQMKGSFFTTFWFGKQPYEDEVFVCQGVTKTRLLGTSLLSKFPQWGIDNLNELFTLGDIKISLVSSMGRCPRNCDVSLVKGVTIPAKSYCFVKAALPNHYNPTEFVFRPDDKVFSSKKVLIPTCLVTNSVYDGNILLKIVNPYPMERTLGKGAKLGKVISNTDEYDFPLPVEELGKSINNIQTSSANEMELALKKNYPEIYNMYMESLKGLDEVYRKELLHILYKYRDVFSTDDCDIGSTTLIKHRIVPKSNKVVYRRQYKHSEEQHRQIDAEVEKLLKSGVIRESMSPFNNPILMVPKKEPGKWRFCLDCRYINDLTENEYFPIPRIDDAMDSLAGADIFTVLDMTSGYHQVPLDEETSDMCAFSTRKGHYQYTRLPMGLRNSGMTFQKMVTLLMAGMLHEEVLAYLDDCILYSKSTHHHLKLLKEVLSRFKNAGLKLKPKKCKLFRKEIVYLGFLVNAEGIRPNPDAAKKIRELKEPTCVYDVQQFLGKVNYYRKFIPKLAEIAHPLYELTKTKQKNKFQWNAEHQSAFDQLKSLLCSGQVMGHPRFDQDFILDVDASDFALGIELSQVDENGDERPIYYGSRHLEKAEKNYSATARETLAAVFGCEYFAQYLQGRKFILRTDHNPLVWLRDMKNPKRPYNGWIVRLEQFNYIIKYRRGKDHVNADFNSRIQPTDDDMGRRSIGVQTITCAQVDATDDKKPWCSYIPYSSEDLVNVQDDANKDGTYSALVETTVTSKNEVKHHIASDGIKQDPTHSALNETAMKQPKDKVSHQKESNGMEPDENHSALVEAAMKPPNNRSNLVKDTPGMLAEATARIESDGKVCEVTREPSKFLVDRQNEDANIGPLIQKMVHPEDKVEFTEKGERLWRIRKNLELKEGLLIRKHKLSAGRLPIEQIVLPDSMKEMVLESLHDDILSGHLGVKKTLARIKLRYYWPGYIDDVEKWCQSCMVCQKRKSPQSLNIPPLQSIGTGQGPFEQIALDILKLPRTTRGNQFALVIEDYFSKWVEVFPLQRTIAPSVAQCVLNGWVSRFGCPYTILSDQGQEFESMLFKELNDAIQTSKLRTTAYHPRTDGMVERCNRTLIDILSKFATTEPDWDLKLPLVLFAIRTSEHASTGFSPFLLTYGKEARIPWDIVYGAPSPQPLPRDEWVASRKKDMETIFQMVQLNTKKAQKHQKTYYDRNLKCKFQTFEKDDLIMVCDPAARSKEGKLNNPWSGPHKVLEKLSDSLYKVQFENEKEKIINTERIKRFYPRLATNKNNSREKNRLDTDSEEEDLSDGDELVIRGEVPTPDEEVEVRDQNADIPMQQRQQADVPVPLMGHRGELWCNPDPRNIINTPRIRHNRNREDS